MISTIAAMIFYFLLHLISDLHCMSDGYLSDELTKELKSVGWISLFSIDSKFIRNYSSALSNSIFFTKFIWTGVLRCGRGLRSCRQGCNCGFWWNIQQWRLTYSFWKEGNQPWPANRRFLQYLIAMQDRNLWQFV